MAAVRLSKCASGLSHAGNQIDRKQTLEGRHVQQKATSASEGCFNLISCQVHSVIPDQITYSSGKLKYSIMLKHLQSTDVLTSLVWKQTASRAAKAKWLLLVNWVSPQMILEQRSRPSLVACSRAVLMPKMF